MVRLSYCPLTVQKTVEICLTQAFQDLIKMKRIEFGDCYLRKKICLNQEEWYLESDKR